MVDVKGLEEGLEGGWVVRWLVMKHGGEQIRKS